MGVSKHQKQKIVAAYPKVNMFGDIRILDDKKQVSIGGFSIDGGFYTKQGFDLVKKKVVSFSGEQLTYYNFVKVPNVKGILEKVLIKQKREELKHREKRKGELWKELKELDEK